MKYSEDYIRGNLVLDETYIDQQKVYRTNQPFSYDFWEIIIKNQEKAEKWDKLIDSFTYDFEPVEDVEEITRQFIDNEIRTTHKLYEENKDLKFLFEKYHDFLPLGMYGEFCKLTKEGDC
jgi:hypothetical protein